MDKHQIKESVNDDANNESDRASITTLQSLEQLSRRSVYFCEEVDEEVSLGNVGETIDREVGRWTVRRYRNISAPPPPLATSDAHTLERYGKHDVNHKYGSRPIDSDRPPGGAVENYNDGDDADDSDEKQRTVRRREVRRNSAQQMQWLQSLEPASLAEEETLEAVVRITLPRPITGTISNTGSRSIRRSVSDSALARHCNKSGTAGSGGKAAAAAGYGIETSFAELTSPGETVGITGACDATVVTQAMPDSAVYRMVALSNNIEGLPAKVEGQGREISYDSDLLKISSSAAVYTSPSTEQEAASPHLGSSSDAWARTSSFVHCQLDKIAALQRARDAVMSSVMEREAERARVVSSKYAVIGLLRASLDRYLQASLPDLLPPQRRAHYAHLLAVKCETDRALKVTVSAQAAVEQMKAVVWHQQHQIVQLEERLRVTECKRVFAAGQDHGQGQGQGQFTGASAATRDAHLATEPSNYVPTPPKAAWLPVNKPLHDFQSQGHITDVMHCDTYRKQGGCGDRSLSAYIAINAAFILGGSCQLPVNTPLCDTFTWDKVRYTHGHVLDPGVSTDTDTVRDQSTEPNVHPAELLTKK